MKRYIVKQTGHVHLDVTRTFVVEVPDLIEEESLERHLQVTPDLEKAEWEDESSTRWVGYEATVEGTSVSEVKDDSSTDELPVLRLEDIK